MQTFLICALSRATSLKISVGGYGCFFSEQFRTSIAVMKLTYIYWSPNILRCSYTVILKSILQSFRRFTNLKIGEECLRRSYWSARVLCTFSFCFKVVFFFQSVYSTHLIYFN